MERRDRLDKILDTPSILAIAYIHKKRTIQIHIGKLINSFALKKSAVSATYSRLAYTRDCVLLNLSITLAVCYR